MDWRGEIAVIEGGLLKILESFGIIVLLVVANTPFFIADMSEVGFDALGESFNSLLNKFHVDFACAFSQEGKSFMSI